MRGRSLRCSAGCPRIRHAESGVCQAPYEERVTTYGVRRVCTFYKFLPMENSSFSDIARVDELFDHTGFFSLEGEDFGSQ